MNAGMLRVRRSTTVAATHQKAHYGLVNAGADRRAYSFNARLVGVSGGTPTQQNGEGGSSSNSMHVAKKSRFEEVDNTMPVTGALQNSVVSMHNISAPNVLTALRNATTTLDMLAENTRKLLLETKNKDSATKSFEDLLKKTKNYQIHCANYKQPPDVLWFAKHNASILLFKRRLSENEYVKLLVLIFENKNLSDKYNEPKSTQELDEKFLRLFRSFKSLSHSAVEPDLIPTGKEFDDLLRHEAKLVEFKFNRDIEELYSRAKSSSVMSMESSQCKIYVQDFKLKVSEIYNYMEALGQNKHMTWQKEAHARAEQMKLYYGNYELVSRIHGYLSDLRQMTLDKFISENISVRHVYKIILKLYNYVHKYEQANHALLPPIAELDSARETFLRHLKYIEYYSLLAQSPATDEQTAKTQRAKKFIANYELGHPSHKLSPTILQHYVNQWE